MRFAGLFATLALVFAAAAAPAAAQEGGSARQGFFFSGGLGYGSMGIGCDGCDGFGREGGLSGYLKLGGTLSPQFLLGVETNGWYKSTNGVTATIGNLSGAAYFYPMPAQGLFLKAGVGYSVLSLDNGFDDGNETGLGFTAGAGYDIPIGGNTSVTPVLNYFRGNFDGGNANVFQAGVGITLH